MGPVAADPPGAPSDGTTLAAILEVLERDGFVGQFGAIDGGEVMCFTCHHATPAGEVDVECFRRLEGASDPDDMLYVAGVRCRRCGQRGPLVLGFGPEASPQDVDVMTTLPSTRAPIIRV